MDELQIVKEGTFLYDGTILCGVRIVLRQTRAGFGDLDDSPDIREDLDIPTFCVGVTSTVDFNSYNDNFTGYDSLDEAVNAVASSQWAGPTLQWK